MNYANLEELLIELDLNPRSKIDILKKTGKKVKTNKYFVVTEDGHCHLFSKDGKLDDISKITKIYESYIDKDIKKIIIPDSVVSIKDYAFYNCGELTNVTIGNRVTSIEYGAFCECGGLIHVTIPDSVKNIGNYAFDSCNGLTSVTISDSVTNIGYAAFYNCTKLAHMTIPNSVTNIRGYAFYECSRLTNVMIPNGVTNIGEYAFACNALRSLVFKGKTMDQVKEMMYYPFGIKDESIISVK